KRDPEPGRQTDLDLLRQHVIGPIEAERVTLIDQTGEHGSRWQDVGLREVRKTASRKARRRSVRAGDFLACDDDVFTLRRLRPNGTRGTNPTDTNRDKRESKLKLRGPD